MRTHKPAFVTVLVAATAILGACSESPRDGASDTGGDMTSGTVRVGVALYPIEEIVRRVGGERVEIVHITPPGVNSHDVELSAKTLDLLADADIVFYLGDGFQPRVEDAVGQLPATVRTVDMLELDGISKPAPDPDHSDSDHSDSDHSDSDHSDSDHSDSDHSHGGEDPHVWLDPSNMIVMTRAVESALTDEIGDDPVVASEFAANADVYAAELAALDEDVAAGLGACATSTVITSHEAFGHLFGRLGLDHLSITGLDPAEQPSARVLSDIAAAARDAGVTTIFVDATVSARFAETIASEIGASVAVLDPVESLSAEAVEAGETYVSLQRDNLRALADGLGCR